MAAIVQLTRTSAAILIASAVRPGEFGVVARSRAFSFAQEANFGVSVEAFRFTPPDRIELSLSARDGCARHVATHRFVLRHGTWLVSGLDMSAMRCTDHGVDQDWSESSNFLTGQAVRTSFAPSKPPSTVQGRASRPPFPLSEFPPRGPESAYAELQ